MLQQVYFFLLCDYLPKKNILNIDKLHWRRNECGRITKWFLKFSEGIAVKFSHANVTDNKLIKRYTSINHKASSLLIEFEDDYAKYKDLIHFLDYQYRKRPTNANFSSLKDTYLQKRGMAHLKNPAIDFNIEEK